MNKVRSSQLRGSTDPSRSFVASSAIGSAIVLGLGTTAYASVAGPAIAFSLVALLIAWIFPKFTISTAVLWILICRVGNEVITVDIAGLALTEIDVLIALTLVSALKLRGHGAIKANTPGLIAVAVWPLWMLVRSSMPMSGPVIPGSSLVDLRYLEVYLLAPAVAQMCAHLGWKRVLELLCHVGYLACGIAIVAWAAFMAGLVPAGEYSLVHLSGSAARDVRPGGEILIPIVAILCIRGLAPKLLGSRLLPVLLIAGEILVSQTLSLALAVGVGIGITTVLTWRKTNLAVRVLCVVGLVVFAFVASGQVSSTSRFNLSERIGESSAQYRFSELATVQTVLESDFSTAALGAGAGSQVVFSGPLVNEIKRDSHNVYANVALKSGLIGLALYLMPFGIICLRLIRRKTPDALGLFGGFAAVAVLSFTVPFAWSISGMTAIIAVTVVASASLAVRTYELDDS